MKKNESSHNNISLTDIAKKSITYSVMPWLIWVDISKKIIDNTTNEERKKISDITKNTIKYSVMPWLIWVDISKSIIKNMTNEERKKISDIAKKSITYSVMPWLIWVDIAKKITENKIKNKEKNSDEFNNTIPALINSSSKYKPKIELLPYNSLWEDKPKIELLPYSPLWEDKSKTKLLPYSLLSEWEKTTNDKLPTEKKNELLNILQKKWVDIKKLEKELNTLNLNKTITGENIQSIAHIINKNSTKSKDNSIIDKYIDKYKKYSKEEIQEILKKIENNKKAEIKKVDETKIIEEEKNKPESINDKYTNEELYRELEKGMKKAKQLEAIMYTVLILWLFLA